MWMLLYKVALIIVLLIVFATMRRLAKMLDKVDATEQGTLSIAWLQELIFFFIVIYLLVK